MRIYSLFLVAALTAASAFSQNHVQGTSAGGEYLPGTNGADTISSKGGIGDALHDGKDPSKSDGVKDYLDAWDGAKDDIIAGPEDLITADDVDWITIRDVNGNILFRGDGKAYYLWVDLAELIASWLAFWMENDWGIDTWLGVILDFLAFQGDD